MKGVGVRSGEEDHTEEGAGAVAVASGFRVMPSRPWISSFCRPLLSRNAIFLSVDSFFTSSASRNFFACSMTVSRLGDSGATFSASFAVVSFDWSCHDGTPGFFWPESESLIACTLDAQEQSVGAFNILIVVGP
jgi:hypothetical protein